MPRACSICTHPEQRAIDAALQARVPRMALQQKYHVTLDALRRHVEQHRLAPRANRIANNANNANNASARPRESRVTPPIASTRDTPTAIIEPVNDSRQAPAETPGQPPTSSADHPEPLMSPMTPPGERTPEGDELTPLAVLKQGLPYVRRAVALAGADRAMQEQLVMVLNHALAEAALGL